MESDKKIISQFRLFLDEVRYSQIISNLLLVNGLHEVVQIQNYEKMKDILFYAEDEIKDLLRLFLLGESIRRNRIINFPKNLLEGLIQIGILRMEGQYICTNNLLVIKALNKLLFVDIPYYFPTCKKTHTEVYIGLDSYMLMINLYEKLQKRKYCKALDICSGSGLQAIITSDYVDCVDAIELNAYAAKIAKYNTYLNRCDMKVSIKNDNYFDLRNTLTGYDLIISNPPFLPVTDKLQFSAIGNGGEDGLRFLRQILSDLNQIGNGHADGIFIGECFGSENDSDVLRLLTSTEDKLPFVVLYTIKSCAENAAKRIANMIFAQVRIRYQTAYAALASQFCEEKPYYYTYIVEVGNIPVTQKLIDISNKWKYTDIPTLENWLHKEETVKHCIHLMNGFELQVSKGMMKCLGDIDGKRSVREIIEKNQPFLSPEDTIEVFLGICGELQSMKILGKKT